MLTYIFLRSVFLITFFPLCFNATLEDCGLVVLGVVLSRALPFKMEQHCLYE